MKLRTKLLIAAFALPTLLILAAPTFLSTSYIYQSFIHSLAQDKLYLEVQGIRLSWFRPIEVSNIVIADLAEKQTSSTEEYTKLLTIKSIRADRGLLGFLLGGRKLGRIEIIDPKIDVSLLEDSSNLQRLIESLQRAHQAEVSKRSKEAVPNPKLDFEIAVRRATVEVRKQGDAKPLVVVPPFDVTAQYRAVDQEPTLVIQPTKALDHVALTQDLVRLGLGKALPLLAKSAWFDGSISLNCDEITIPLEHAIDSQGKLQITLHQVRTGPTEPLMIQAIELMSKFRKEPAPMELVFVDNSQVQVALENQRVFHSGLEAGLPTFDERLQFSSSGSVGLSDRTLDLTLLVPVPVEQLAFRDTVKELGVPKLRVPVQGTLDQPSVRWELMREDSSLVLQMMASQLEKGDAKLLGSVVGSLGSVAKGDADEAIGAVISLASSLREARNQAKAKAEAEKQNPPPSEKPKTTNRPILDAFRKALQPKP